MNKVLLDSRAMIYPTALFLVGAEVDGKANFMALAWGSTVNNQPSLFSVAISHRQHTLKGIRQNMVFSVNIPSITKAREADYCGLVSGSEVDKIEACHFNIFYGKVDKAPLIEECPINLACRIERIVDLPDHALVIGQVEENHLSEDCLTDGLPDIEKIKPLVVVTNIRQYHSLGTTIGKAFSIGRQITRDN
jgi:flavin reductase (DIM6/NTAB) family NADH-FMN oxidoreductase RutF